MNAGEEAASSLQKTCDDLSSNYMAHHNHFMADTQPEVFDGL